MKRSITRRKRKLRKEWKRRKRKLLLNQRTTTRSLRWGIDLVYINKFIKDRVLIKFKYGSYKLWYF